MGMRLLALLIIAFVMGCLEPAEFIKTQDGYKLTYTYHESGHKGIILLHELGSDRAAWRPLERELEREGFSYIAVDLRGHGGSQGDWVNFENEDFQAMVYDTEAAGKFLKNEGVQIKSVVGASIGANLAIKYAREKEIGTVVLISPGINYRGIVINHDMTNYTGDALVVVGMDDDYSYTTGQMFQRDINASLVKFPGADHGMELLPEATQFIMDFLRQV